MPRTSAASQVFATLGCSSVFSGASSAILYDGDIYDSKGGACTPFPRSTLGDNAKYYRAGVRLDPAELFGEVKLVVRD